jgi:starvation-inducible DNA-binding protein
MSANAYEVRPLNPTRNGLPAMSRLQAADLLNRRLADAIDLQCQCKQAHWNVKGDQFISLHELFDEVHGEIAEYVDRLAERVVQLGGTAEGTVRVAAERSELDEYPVRMWKGADHIRCLSLALAAFGSRVRFAVQGMDELEDVVSADLCAEIASGIDQSLWFVEAHAQES